MYRYMRNQKLMVSYEMANFYSFLIKKLKIYKHLQIHNYKEHKKLSYTIFKPEVYIDVSTEVFQSYTRACTDTAHRSVPKN